MKYMDSVIKTLEKGGIQVGSSEPPRYWFSTGNYVLNKIISGSFHKGIPQGRVTGLAGPSGAGKSFLAANVIKSAQLDGAQTVVLDSENALDDSFVSAIGVDPTKDYTYVDINTIGDCQTVVSQVVAGYAKEYADCLEDAPKLLLVIDSLDMMLTNTEFENVTKGIQKGDQGQRNKQLKAMLRGFVHSIKRLNISIVVTSQVYENQDIMNGEGRWIVSGAVKYSLSQIVLLTKLKLKDTGSREVKGIRMKVEGYKTRFTKPFQVVTIEVPYDDGMDPYNGLPAVAVELDIVVKKGSRYAMVGEDQSWYSKDFGKYAQTVLEQAEQSREKFIEGIVEDSEVDNTTDGITAKKRREMKHNKEA